MQTEKLITRKKKVPFFLFLCLYCRIVFVICIYYFLGKGKAWTIYWKNKKVKKLVAKSKIKLL